MSEYDVVVIGGGAAGEVAAGRVADGGLSVALVERELVGGQCSYWACMPSKSLLRPGHVLAEVDRVPGARAAVTGDLDLSAVFDRRDSVASHWNDESQVEWLESHNVDLVRGHARLIGEGELHVEVDGHRMEMKARKAVIIATGSRAAIPPIEGIEEIDAWTNRETTTTRHVDQRMLILGGGAVGVEAAQAWRRLGCGETIVVEREDSLLSGEEPFASEELEKALNAEGIRVLTGTTVERFESTPEGIVVHFADGDRVVTDRVMLAVGRRPATDDLGLETIDMKPGDAIEVDEHQRSARHPGWLYAVGDVDGSQLFTHMGKYEARVAADHILGQDVSTVRGRQAAPRIVFTDPIVAGVGLTEEAAHSQGIAVRTVRGSLGMQAQASIWGEGLDGSAQLVIDADRNVVVGATFTGPPVVAELIHGAQVAIVGEIPLDVLGHVVPQYPTFAEVWLDLLEQV